MLLRTRSVSRRAIRARRLVALRGRTRGCASEALSETGSEPGSRTGSRARGTGLRGSRRSSESQHRAGSPEQTEENARDERAAHGRSGDGAISRDDGGGAPIEPAPSPFHVGPPRRKSKRQRLLPLQTPTPDAQPRGRRSLLRDRLRQQGRNGDATAHSEVLTNETCPSARRRSSGTGVFSRPHRALGHAHERADARSLRRRFRTRGSRPPPRASARRASDRVRGPARTSARRRRRSPSKTQRSWLPFWTPPRSTTWAGWGSPETGTQWMKRSRRSSTRSPSVASRSTFVRDWQRRPVLVSSRRYFQSPLRRGSARASARPGTAGRARPARARAAAAPTGAPRGRHAAASPRARAPPTSLGHRFRARLFRRRNAAPRQQVASRSSFTVRSPWGAHPRAETRVRSVENHGVFAVVFVSMLRPRRATRKVRRAHRPRSFLKRRFPSRRFPSRRRDRVSSQNV